MFSSSLVLLGACLTAINVLSGVDARECDDGYMISIENSTDIDFYKTCPNLNSTLFFIDHTFTGPFEMAGVESLYQMSSGYYGPKLKGSDRVDDGVTSVSMPDLVDITTGGMLFGYVDNLTSISFPKLSTMVGDLAIAGSYELRNISLPALSTIDGAIYLDGDFDQVESTGNISCPALGAAWASINFTGDDTDLYQGFTCWTGYETNSWNSSDPDNNPGSNSSSDTKNSAANATRVGWVASFFLFLAWVL